METILQAIKSFRLTEAGLEERQIQEHLHRHLLSLEIPAKREVHFAPRCRADIWVEDGIVIELKKQRPATAAVYAQLERYAQTGKVKALILVLERSVQIPLEIHGIQVRVVSLNSLWGIAL